MKRAIFLCSLTFIFSVGQTLAGLDVGETKVYPTFGKSAAGKTCPFIIAGMWKLEGRTEADSLFYSFTTEGWVRVVSHSAEALPREYEIIAEVKYALDNPSAPKRVEFITARGN